MRKVASFTFKGTPDEVEKIIRDAAGEMGLQVKEVRMLKPGNIVLYADPTRKIHLALVTTAWSNDYINVVLVSPDEKMTDQYGRQIQRETSVPRLTDATKGGRCFMDIRDEEAMQIGIDEFYKQLDAVPQRV